MPRLVLVRHATLRDDLETGEHGFETTEHNSTVLEAEKFIFGRGKISFDKSRFRLMDIHSASDTKVCGVV